MCELDEFFQDNPITRKNYSFDAQSLLALEDLDIPDDIVQFLKEQGYSTYRDDFLATTLPQEHFQTLSEWGLDGDRCFTFLRTAFGSLCFCYTGKIFQLDPISGYVYKGIFEFCDFMNMLVTMDAFMESNYFDVYQKIKKSPAIGYDEIYALFPAIPLGGSFETSAYEVVKMREHLGFLAQLFGNKAKVL